MNVKKRFQLRIRGWFPQEPALKVAKKTNVANGSCKAELDRKAFNRAAVANALMVGGFSGTHALIDPYSKSIEVTVLSWGLFVSLLILVNVWIYRHYKKQTISCGGT
jgi:hypothetical protein